MTIIFFSFFAVFIKIDLSVHKNVFALVIINKKSLSPHPLQTAWQKHRISFSHQ